MPDALCRGLGHWRKPSFPSTSWHSRLFVVPLLLDLSVARSPNIHQVGHYHGLHQPSWMHRKLLSKKKAYLILSWTEPHLLTLPVVHIPGMKIGRQIFSVIIILILRKILSPCFKPFVASGQHWMLIFWCQDSLISWTELSPGAFGPSQWML